MTRDLAIQTVLNIALIRGSAVKGIAEVLKALEAQKVKCVFLAEDCDNDQYKEIIIQLAKENGVPVLSVPTWESLKDYCKLGLLSSTIKEIAEQRGKEAKIKPRCSSCAIIDWGEESEAKNFLNNELKI